MIPLLEEEIYVAT